MPLALRAQTFFGEDIGDREFLVDGCDPYGACRNQGNCLMHSEWVDPEFNINHRCGKPDVYGDPCQERVEKSGEICIDCRQFEVMCKEHDEAMGL